MILDLDWKKIILITIACKYYHDLPATKEAEASVKASASVVLQKYFISAAKFKDPLHLKSRGLLSYFLIRFRWSPLLHRSARGLQKYFIDFRMDWFNLFLIRRGFISASVYLKEWWCLMTSQVTWCKFKKWLTVIIRKSVPIMKMEKLLKLWC